MTADPEPYMPAIHDRVYDVRAERFGRVSSVCPGNSVTATSCSIEPDGGVGGHWWTDAANLCPADTARSPR